MTSESIANRKCRACENQNVAVDGDVCGLCADKIAKSGLYNNTNQWILKMGIVALSVIIASALLYLVL